MIRLVFDNRDLLHVRFAVSPAEEILGAVRTIADPARHAYHLPWLNVLSGDELDGLAELTELVRARGTPDFLSPPPVSPVADLAGQLQRLRDTAPEVIDAELGEALGPTRPLGLRDPRAARDLLADQLTCAWERLLAPVWDQINALLQADVMTRARRLADRGFAAVFDALHPGVRSDDRVLLIDDEHYDERVELAGDGLVLIPSVFTWPDVQVMVAPWPTSLIYPAAGIGALWQPSEPDPVLSRAFGRTRGRLLNELAEPATTTSLARTHRMARSAVSAHLTALRDAGLLTSHRDGREVRYQLSPLGYALIHARRSEPVTVPRR